MQVSSGKIQEMDMFKEQMGVDELAKAMDEGDIVEVPDEESMQVIMRGWDRQTRRYYAKLVNGDTEPTEAFIACEKQRRENRDKSNKN